jgi:hypothetical protein
MLLKLKVLKILFIWFLDLELIKMGSLVTEGKILDFSSNYPP